MKLTYTQIRVLNWLREFHTMNGYMPTQIEIAEHFGWVQNNASLHVSALVRRGAITKIPRTARGLRLTPEGAALVGAASRDILPMMVGLPVLEMRQVVKFSKQLRRPSLELEAA